MENATNPLRNEMLKNAVLQMQCETIGCTNGVRILLFLGPELTLTPLCWRCGLTRES